MCDLARGKIIDFASNFLTKLAKSVILWGEGKVLILAPKYGEDSYIYLVALNTYGVAKR